MDSQSWGNLLRLLESVQDPNDQHPEMSIWLVFFESHVNKMILDLRDRDESSSALVGCSDIADVTASPRFDMSWLGSKLVDFPRFVVISENPATFPSLIN
jgi:hypothetical protein